ncbi:MAG TPA: glycosyltransferase [Patescibacteria group bacterium]|nr:glycosyltransferase [Patescibacteria group bacterium]
MQVIVFSWEYPPRIVGKLSNYVKTLATQLMKYQTQPYVVTYHDYLVGEHNDSNGVKTFWVTNPVRTHIGVLTWVLTLNQEVERVAADIYYDKKKQIDLIDVHDWHFIPAATTLKKALGIPFVYSVESLEDQRSHAANTPFNMAIKSIEWLGTYEAQQLVVKSAWMRDEVQRSYKTPREKLSIVLPDSNGWLKETLKIYENAAEKGAEA